MGFNPKRWLLAALSRKEIGVDQLGWKYLRFSYSQYAEDLIAESLLPDRPGFYVDIGAYHPFTLSNTYRFYRKGWRGVVVDANEERLRLFGQWRPRDIQVHAALSDTERTAVFEIHRAGVGSQLAGAGPEGTLDKHDSIVRRVEMRTRTLRSVLEEHVPKGEAVLFLSIDCEHEDLAILRSNDWTKFRPMVIAVEDWEANAETSGICQYLGGLGYELAATVSVSRIFRDGKAKA